MPKKITSHIRDLKQSTLQAIELMLVIVGLT